VDPSILFLVALLFIAFLIFQRGNRQRRDMARVQREVGPGAEVMMASGLYATVTALDDEVVTVEASPGQLSRWDRRAVMRIVNPAPAAEPGDAVAADDSESVAFETSEPSSRSSTSTDEPA
jgi:preprotein translocase subunit YajC